MGAGKSTIGRLLASRLNFTFIDTDHLIEERSGADIPWIFDVEGEAGFRARETAILLEAIENSNQVISTGGGIVLSEQNRQAIKRATKVFYLCASLEQLIQRTYKDKKRPLLQVENPEARLRELLETRESLYLDVATHTIKTDGRSPRNVVQEILEIV